MKLATIRYGAMRAIGEFVAKEDDYSKGDRCIIQTPRGIEVGIVLIPPRPVDERGNSSDRSGQILRPVNQQDGHLPLVLWLIQ